MCVWHWTVHCSMFVICIDADVNGVVSILNVCIFAYFYSLWYGSEIYSPIIHTCLMPQMPPYTHTWIFKRLSCRERQWRSYIEKKLYHSNLQSRSSLQPKKVSRIITFNGKNMIIRTWWCYMYEYIVGIGIFMYEIVVMYMFVGIFMYEIVYTFMHIN